jgi:translation initiation factor 1
MPAVQNNARRLEVKKRGSSETPLVYSSEYGRMCPECGRPVAECICRKSQGAAAGDGVVRIRRETKGRGGKTVTVITGVPLDAQGVKDLAGELKRCCGSGGTVKDGIIEIQGDHGTILIPELERRGFRVKRAGG